MSVGGTKAERKDLFEIRDQWKEMFGEYLMLGFPTGTKQLPILRRCVRDKDPSEYKEWLSAEIQRKKEKRWLW